MQHDEYTTLIRKESISNDIDSVKNPDKPKSQKKNHKRPFKKGSWKDWMYKKLKKLHSPRRVSGFHDNSLESVIIYRKSKPKLVISKRRFTDDLLEKLRNKYQDDCYVLINCGDSMYYRLSLKSYLKLSEIWRVSVTMELYAEDDYDQGPYLIQEFDRTIHTINDFMHLVIYIRALIDGVAETQAQTCGFTYHKYKFRTVIIKADGKADAYKGDFNEVLKEYGITPLL